MKHTFTIENAYKFAWDKMKKYWAQFLGLGVITFLVNTAFSIPMVAVQILTSSPKLDMYGEEVISAFGRPEVAMSVFGGSLYAVLYIASIIVSLWLAYNTYKIILEMVDDKKVRILDIFKWDNTTAGKLARYFLATLALVAVVLVGLILLIIPGIYFGIKYMFVPYLVLDKNMNIGDAFRKSGEMTNGNMLKMIAFALVSFAIMIVGLLALIVGLIPAMILTTFAGLYIYRKLADGHVNGEHGHTEKVVE